jgi:hypothetical protein
VPTKAYTPRKFVEEESPFGWAEHPPWVRPAGEPDEHLRGSVVQHLYARFFNRKFADKWADVQTFCTSEGVKYDRLTRVLKGQMVLKLEEIGLFAHALGVNGIPEPKAVVDEVRRAFRLVEEAAEARDASDDEDLVTVEDVMTMDLIHTLGGDLQELQRAAAGAIGSLTMERIRTFASTALEHSAWALRARERADWPNEVPIELEIEARGSARDVRLVDAMPTDESIFGTVTLDRAWLKGAGRSGLTEIDDHFVLAYRKFDDQDRPIEVDALRLLPTAFGLGSDLEYTASPATVTWIVGVPFLYWNDQDSAVAAAAWLVATHREGR